MANWLQRWARQLRHRFQDQGAESALPQAARERIAHAISASEQRHTGQIRVYVESALPWSYIRRDAPARERALMEFSKQRVWDTEHNNGVLIYLLLTDHAIEIVADRAVSRQVNSQQWQAVVAQLGNDLRSGSYEQALLAAIAQVSALLERDFPRLPGSAADTHPNELPDAPIVH